MASRITERSWRNVASRARCRLTEYRGTAISSSVAMMAITTSSSISVNPRFTLPITIWDSVDARSRRQRSHVEHVVSRLWISRRARITAQPPGRNRRRRGIRKERIARHAAQKVDARPVGIARVFDAADQHVERRRIAGGAELGDDPALVGRGLVGIDRGTQLAQRAAQFLFLGRDGTRARPAASRRWRAARRWRR